MPDLGEEANWNPALPPTLTPPVNFPSEPFYHLVEAAIGLNGGGTAFLRLALEFAFGNEDPIDGDQIVFNRFRTRINAPVTGRYRVVHPWGTYRQDVLALGPGFEINVTQDVRCDILPYDFDLALADAPDRITGPFLRWDTDFPVIGAVSGAAYLGDPRTPSPEASIPIRSPDYLLTSIGLRSTRTLTEPLRQCSARPTSSSLWEGSLPAVRHLHRPLAILHLWRTMTLLLQI